MSTRTTRRWRACHQSMPCANRQSARCDDHGLDRYERPVRSHSLSAARARRGDQADPGSRISVLLHSPRPKRHFTLRPEPVPTSSCSMDTLLPEHHRAVLLTKRFRRLWKSLPFAFGPASRSCLQFDRCRMPVPPGLVITDDEQALTAWAHESTEDLYVELTPSRRCQPRLPSADGLVFRRWRLPARFLYPAGFARHRLSEPSLSIRRCLTYSPNVCCAPTHWLMPAALMEQYFPHVPAALENTGRIAAACHTDWHFGETIFPTFRRLSDGESFDLLKDKTYGGALTRYGTLSLDIRERIEHELTLIRDKGFAHYFLIVEEIVRQAPRTCGRGFGRRIHRVVLLWDHPCRSHETSLIF